MGAGGAAICKSFNQNVNANGEKLKCSLIRSRANRHFVNIIITSSFLLLFSTYFFFLVAFCVCVHLFIFCGGSFMIFWLPFYSCTAINLHLNHRHPQTNWLCELSWFFGVCSPVETMEHSASCMYVCTYVCIYMYNWALLTTKCHMILFRIVSFRFVPLDVHFTCSLLFVPIIFGLTSVRC